MKGRRLYLDGVSVVFDGFRALNNLALVYPRAITFVGEMPQQFQWTRQLYEKLGAGAQIRTIDDMSSWRPAP